MNYTMTIVIFVIIGLLIMLAVVFYKTGLLNSITLGQNKSEQTTTTTLQTSQTIKTSTTSTTSTNTTETTTTSSTSPSAVPLFNSTPSSGGSPPLPPV